MLQGWINKLRIVFEKYNLLYICGVMDFFLNLCLIYFVCAMEEVVFRNEMTLCTVI